MEQNQYRAFISYRHESPDDRVAKALHTAIETYRIPADIRKKTGQKRMGRVFRDQEELPLSSDLGADIETALDNSEWFIAICSPRYLESRWCQRELEYFIEKKGQDRVLAILVDGEPDVSFPERLQYEVDENGARTPIEPLAADVRGASWKARLKNEKLRLMAPMLGVAFDELKRRERQRTIRKTIAVSAAALAAAAGLAVFLSVSHARNERLRLEAEEQARIAEAERVRAEEQKARAEEEKARAEEEKARAEEERARAEEEERKKEQERRNAVFNDLGERLERASAALRTGEKRAAASIMLEALPVSEENGDMRREELIGQLRKALYIEPFTVVSSFNNQNVRVNDITVSPDGTRAIGIVNSNSVAMIDLNANEIVYQVSVGNTMILGLCFSADGSRFLAQCDMGRLVTVWNASDGSVAFSYTSKNDQQYQIANALFWKDSSQVLVQDMEHFYLVSEDGAEKLFYTMGDQMPEYDREKNLLAIILGRPIEQVLTFHNDDYVGTEVMATADRSRVVIAGVRGDTAVIVLDDSGNRVSLLGVSADYDSYMPGVLSEKWALSPDGRTAACLSLFGFICGWDTDSGELIVMDTFEYTGGFDSSEIAFSADSERMAYTAEDHLYVDIARTGEHVLTASIDETNIVPSVAFTEDGNYLLMTNQSMFIINAHTWALELLGNADSGPSYNNVIPLKDTFLITRSDGTANFFSTPSLASVRSADSFDRPLCEPVPASFPCVPLKGEHRLTDAFLVTAAGMDTTPGMTFSRDGKTAALAYADGVIELFDTEGDGSVRTMIGELSSRITALAMTEKRLVAADQSARLLIYDMEGRGVLRILNTGTSYAGFAFDPEGKLAMALSGDLARIDVYSLETYEKLFSLSAAGDTFTNMAFSRDGAYAVGETASGGCVIGSIWTDEKALLDRARILVGGES